MNYIITEVKFETTSSGINVTGDGTFSGNVGINDTSPDAKLHITSTSGNHLRLAYSDSFYWDIAREAADGRLSFTDNVNGEAVLSCLQEMFGIETTSPSHILT